MLHACLLGEVVEPVYRNVRIAMVATRNSPYLQTRIEKAITRFLPASAASRIHVLPTMVSFLCSQQFELQTSVCAVQPDDKRYSLHEHFVELLRAGSTPACC